MTTLKRIGHVQEGALLPPEIRWEVLLNLTMGDLRKLGFYCWNDDGLMLIPVEFYDSIPDDSHLVNTEGHREFFRSGRSSKDTCQGLLSYGFYACDSPGRNKTPLYYVVTGSGWKKDSQVLSNGRELVDR